MVCGLMSERTVCKLLGEGRSSYRYEPRQDRNLALREALVKLPRQKRFCCINLSGTQFFACAQADQAAISKSLLTNWISPAT